MSRTLIFLAVLASLLGVILFSVNRNEAALESVETKKTALEPNFLFAEQESSIIGLKIVKDDTTLELVRSEFGFWTAVQPDGADVPPGVVEAAVSQLRSLPLLEEDLLLSESDIGIREQAPLVSVTYLDSNISDFRMGDPTPSGSGYYIQASNGAVHIVDRDSLDTLLKLLQYFDL